MSPTADDPLLALLSHWLSAQQRSTPVSPEELCRDRPDLLPELLAAIRAHQQLAPHAATVNEQSQLSRRTPPGLEQLPTFIGGFRITHRLGGGGMGEVYAARDQALNRDVALKVMRPDVATCTGAAARFLREARATASLQHDHIVPVYAVGEQDGFPYLVMPLLAGETLAERLVRQGRLPTPEVIALGRQVAEGLAAAHAAGIVHRDVKPSNLWLQPGNGIRVKILDFGLAWSAGYSDQRLTATGAILGTPCYMSPEQADGRSSDPRTDVFALGAVLYETAVGVAPFRRPTLTATLKAVGDFDPPALAVVATDIPRALSDLIERMLAKSAGDRPSADAVATELSRMSADTTLSPPQTSTVPVWSAATIPPDPVPTSVPQSTREPRTYRFSCTVVISFCLLATWGWMETYNSGRKESDKNIKLILEGNLKNKDDKRTKIEKR